MNIGFTKIFCLLSFLTMFFIISYPVIAGTITSRPTQDTYVKQSSPSTNYGNLDYMQIGQDGQTTMMYAYLKFPTSDVPTGQIIDSAQCNIYIYERNVPERLMIRIYDNCGSWGETTTNWNNKPSCSRNYFTTPQWTSSSLPPMAYYTWDCTTSFRDYYNNGRQDMDVALIAVNPATLPDYIGIRSREYSNFNNKPYVAVDYHAQTTTTTTKTTTTTTRTTTTTTTTIPATTTTISTTTTTVPITTTTTPTTTTIPVTTTSTTTTSTTTTTTISNICPSATAKGKVFKNNQPVNNALVEGFINNVFVGSSVTNSQGNYTINLSNYLLHYPLTLQATVDGKKFNTTNNIICGITNTIDIYTTAPTPIYNLIPIMVYTKDQDGNYERTFGHGQTVNVNVVFRNPTKFSVTGVFDVKIIYGDGSLVSYLVNGLNVNLEPSSWKTYSFNYPVPSSLGWFKSSGYDFYGYKVYASVVEDCSLISNPVTKVLCVLQNSNKYGFFVDEHNEPRWLRDMMMINVRDKSTSLISTADRTNNVNYLTAGFDNLLTEIKNANFNTILGPEYYSYGYLESHQPQLNYWAPAGNSPNSYYSTPQNDLVHLTGSISSARNMIKSLVDKAHTSSIKVVEYTDPIVMYYPDSYIMRCDQNSVANSKSTNPSYVRMINQQPKRTSWIEDIFPACFPYPSEVECNGLESIGWQHCIFSYVDHFLVETSACGVSKSGSANSDYGFSPSVIDSDLATGENWENDPSFHYHIVKQTRWLTKNYGFDGILADDIGRVILNYDASKTGGDMGNYWKGEYATSPTNSRYGIAENSDCKAIQQGSGASDDAVTADSVAGMLKHMRTQMKDYNSDNSLIISDYFAPSTVGWGSVYGTADMHNSDQFPLLSPEFARYAYDNFNYDFKPIRTDLRRSLTFESTLWDKREAWFRGVFLGAAWANRANVEITYEDFLTSNTAIERNVNLMYKNYNKMRQNLDNNPNFKLYTSMVGQNLLYNSLLPETQTNNEVEYFYSDRPDSDIKPYYILYDLPSSYGIAARILHVMNVRNDVQYLFNSQILTDYTFKIKIPVGQDIDKIYLISPDTKMINGAPHPDPNGDNNPDDSYYVDITNEHTLWSRGQNGDIKITAPQVASYTIVYIKFTPIKDPSENLKYSPNVLEGFSLSFTSNITQDQYIDQNITVSSNTTLFDTSLYYPTGKLDLHFHDPSGRHIGYNYTTSSIDLIPNSYYYLDSGKEEIKVDNPSVGTWKISVYGKTVPSEYSSTGMFFVSRTLREGNYSPNLILNIPNQNLTLNEFTYLPFSINNIGDALAFNISVSFSSPSFNFYENEFNNEKILSENGMTSVIEIIPSQSGIVSLNYNLTYYDEDFNFHYILGSIPIRVVAEPKLTLFEMCNVEKRRFNSFGTCHMNVTNIGSDRALDVKISNILSQGIQNSSVAEFSVDELLPNQFLMFDYNITLENGDRSITAYSDYQNSNNELFSNAYMLNLFIEEDYTPPNITTYSPANNNSYYKVNVSLDFTINEPISWIGYSLNGTANKTITGPTNITGLTDGWKNVIVYANDTSGNMGSSAPVNFFYCKSDINKDKKVDILDTTLITTLYGAKCGDANYNPNRDLNGDCNINILDVTLVTGNYGKKC